MSENIGTIYSDFVLDASKFQSGWNQIKSAISSLPGLFSSATDGAKRSFENIEQGAQKSATTLSSLNEKLLQLRSRLDSTEIGSKAFKTLQSDIKKTEEEISKANKTGGAFSDVLSGVSGSAGLVGTAIAGFSGILAGQVLVEGIKNVVMLGAQFEQTRVSFETMLGDVDKAMDLLSSLGHLADVTPFNDEQIIRSGKTLLSFGTEARDVVPTLRVLGDVASGTGKDLNELTVIYGQIMNSGHLMGQDLLQLINAGFNPLEAIAKRTGKSLMQLKEEMSAGRITSQMVQQAFIDVTSEGGRFANMMEKQSHTLIGLWSTMESYFARLGRSSGTLLSDSLKPILEWAIQTADLMTRMDFSPVEDAFKGLGESLKTLYEMTGAKGLFDNDQLNITDWLIRSIAGAIFLSIAPAAKLALTWESMVRSVQFMYARIHGTDEEILSAADKLNEIDRKLQSVQVISGLQKILFGPVARQSTQSIGGMRLNANDVPGERGGGRGGRQPEIGTVEFAFYDKEKDRIIEQGRLIHKEEEKRLKDLRERYEFEARLMEQEQKQADKEADIARRAADIAAKSASEVSERNDSILLFYDNLEKSLGELGSKKYEISFDLSGESKAVVDKLEELKTAGKIDFSRNIAPGENGSIVSQFHITPRDPKDQETLEALRNLTDSNKNNVAKISLQIEEPKEMKWGRDWVQKQIDSYLKKYNTSLSGIGDIFNASMEIWQTQINQRTEMMRRHNDEQMLFLNVFSAKFEEEKQKEIDDVRRAEDEKIAAEKNASEIRIAMLDEEYQRKKEILDRQYQDQLEADRIDFDRKKQTLDDASSSKEQALYSDSIMEEDYTNLKKKREQDYQQALVDLAKDVDKQKETEKKQSDTNIAVLEKQKNDKISAMEKDRVEQEKATRKTQAFINWQFQSASLEMTKRIQVAQTTIQTVTAAAQTFGAIMAALSMIPIVGPFIALPTALGFSGMILNQGVTAVRMIENQVVLPPAELAMADGGVLRGPGGPRDDTIPAWLSPGEGVIDAVKTEKMTRAIDEGIISKQPRIYNFQFEKDSVHVRDENDIERISQAIMSRIESRTY